MRIVAFAVLLAMGLPGCLSALLEPSCTQGWALYWDQDVYEAMVAQGADVRVPEHALGGEGLPGHEPGAALVEVRWKQISMGTGGNGPPHLALYAGDPPSIGLQDGEGMDDAFLVSAAEQFMPTRAAAESLVAALKANPQDDYIDFRADAPEADVDGLTVDGVGGGGRGLGFWSSQGLNEHRLEFEWRSDVARLESEGLHIRADPRGNVAADLWIERPGPEVHPHIEEAFATAGLPPPTFEQENPVPQIRC